MKRNMAKVFLAAVVLVFAASCALAMDIANEKGFKTALQTVGSHKVINDFVVSEDHIRQWDSDESKKGIECTLDLAGHTITMSGDKAILIRPGSKLTINDSSAEKTGKIFSSTRPEGKVLVQVGGGPTAVSSDAATVLTLNAGTVECSSGATIGIFKNAAFNITGGKVLNTNESGNFAICGNGTQDTENANCGINTTINISGGTVDSKGLAVYHPQKGVLNISGGIITGSDGVQVRSGTVNITGGTVEATGNGVTCEAIKENDKGNGSVDTGAAVSFISSGNGYAGGMSLNISGGTLKSAGANAVLELPTMITSCDVQSVTISGGAFEGKNPANQTENEALHSESGNDIPDARITGGTFNSDISGYLDLNRVTIKNNGDGTWTVETVAGAPASAILPDGSSADVALVSADAVVPTKNYDDLLEFAGISEEHLAKNGAGFVTAAPETIAKIAQTEYNNAAITSADVVPLPAFMVTSDDMPSGDLSKTAMISLIVYGKDLLAEKADDVKVLKILSGGTRGRALEYSKVISGDMEGKFVIQETNGDILSGAVSKTDGYLLSVFIKDDGDYDLCKEPGRIVDPLAIVGEVPTPAPAADDSSGCNAGFAGMLLLLALPLIAKRKD